MNLACFETTMYLEAVHVSISSLFFPRIKRIFNFKCIDYNRVFVSFSRMDLGLFTD